MESVGADDGGEDECPSGDAPEGKVGLFHEVFKIHTVETSDECSGADTECTDGEFEIEEHEGVTVGVEDDVDTEEFC